jgi:hypothetical protein
MRRALHAKIIAHEKSGYTVDMKKLAVAGILFFLAPSLVFAAGFAKQSLFLSKSTVTEGDTVLIHAVISNDTDAKFAGTLILKDETGSIGTVPVTLAAGEADTLSVSWKPLAGTHAVSAELDATDGTVVETQTASFYIAPKPLPAAAAQAAAAVDSSAPIDQAITNVSPAAGSAAQPVLGTIDSARAAAVGVLDSQIAGTKSALAAQSGLVLGAETSKSAAPSSATQTGMTILQTIYLYILTVLRFILASAGIFYPVVAILFLFFLYKLFSRMRRPSWQR